MITFFFIRTSFLIVIWMTLLLIGGVFCKLTYLSGINKTHGASSMFEPMAGMSSRDFSYEFK